MITRLLVVSLASALSTGSLGCSAAPPLCQESARFAASGWNVLSCDGHNMAGLSRKHIIQGCEASLRRLGVDVIDLYQVHQPDLLAHPGEVAEVLTELREAGKVREVGVCNHTAWQTQALQSFLDFPLVSVQVPLNAVRLGSLTDGTLDLAMELGLTPIASSPLASGSLVGEATSKKLQAVAAVFDRIAAEQGAPRVAVVLSWLLHHPAGVVPIVSTSRVARIRQCAEATEVGFSRQQWYEVLAASRGQSLF